MLDDLSLLPREQFRERLRAELLERGQMTMTNLVSAYLTVKGAASAIDFYTKAFGAKETLRLSNPDGTLGHVEMSIGDSCFMLADEHPAHDMLSPETLGGSPMKMHLYVDDVDAFASRAVAAGATIKRPVMDQFYGDRSGSVTDPYGFTWHIATHIEDLTAEETSRRAAKEQHQH